MIIIATRIAFAAFLLCCWQFLSPAFGLEFFLSTPVAIVSALSEQILDGSLFFHAAITTIEAVSGFVLGGTIGMLFGLLLGRVNFLANVLEPFLMAFYSLPKAALAPLFVLWFGIGIDMKVILAASIVFFLVFLNTFTGVRQVSQEQIAILRLMGASERHLLTKVVMPSAVVWVFTGLKLSVPYALIGAIVGEIIASNRGLGYMLAHAAGQFDTAGTFAALFAIMALASILNFLVKFAEARLMPWREIEKRREVTV